MDSTLIENGKYFYLLKQIDTDGNYEYTKDTVKVTVGFVTGIEDKDNFFKFSYS